MRLWHEKLIPELPRQQLLGQHRECCALRGRGWNKKHATVDYVFEHSPFKLYQYHMKVMYQMKKRVYIPDEMWEDPTYRGRSCAPYAPKEIVIEEMTTPIYPEHNVEYLKECLYNLAKKGIRLD